MVSLYVLTLERSCSFIKRKVSSIVEYLFRIMEVLEKNIAFEKGVHIFFYMEEKFVGSHIGDARIKITKSANLQKISPQIS